MAITKLADIIEPAVYLRYHRVALEDQNALIRSGVVATALPEEVSSQMNAGGATIDMPFWNDLTRGAPDIMSDNEATVATPDKITAGDDIAVKHYWHKAWSDMDLSGIVAGDDPLQAVASFTTNWWNNAIQSYLIKSTTGLIADNVANDSSDMVFTAFADTASPTAANKFGFSALTNARLTMGDALSNLTAVAVHSSVYGTMLENDQISFERQSDGPLEIPKFGGKGGEGGITVLVDDDMPIDTTPVNADKYTCFLYGMGAFSFGEGNPPTLVPVEMERNESVGNGGGQDILHHRKVALLHPRGVKFTKSSMAGKSPTEAETILAANWDRVYPRKNVRIAALEVNI